MSTYTTILIETHGEGFIEITETLQQTVGELCLDKKSGIAHLFTPHTSCALCINEAYDPSAKSDMEQFLKHLAPRNLAFIEHTAEGPDDSPSHMKSILLHQSISLIVDKGKLILGQWQGIFLSEFRDGPHQRKLYLKLQLD